MATFYDEANTNRAAAVANIAQLINDLGFGGSSLYPGVDVGSGNGTAIYYLDAYPNYPSTGTVRIRRVSSATFYGITGGQFLANAAGNPDVQSFLEAMLRDLQEAGDVLILQVLTVIAQNHDC